MVKRLPSTNLPFVPQQAPTPYCSAVSGTHGRLLSTSAWALTSTRNHIPPPRVAKYVHHYSRGSQLLNNISSSSVLAVAENPVVSRFKQLWNSHTVIHLVFLCPERLYAARVGSSYGSLVIAIHSNKICMHKSMQSLHVHMSWSSTWNYDRQRYLKHLFICLVENRIKRHDSWRNAC